MKKFNTTLAIAAIALTSVFGFTSCEKDNSAFETRLEKSKEARNQVTNDKAGKKNVAEINRMNQINKEGNHKWVNNIK